MDEMLKRYRHLDVELAYARKAIRTIERDMNIFPEGCPNKIFLKENLDLANELRNDILNDIYKITDTEPTLNLNLLFAIS